mgnify:CR=1 FL=1
MLFCWFFGCFGCFLNKDIFDSIDCAFLSYLITMEAQLQELAITLPLIKFINDIKQNSHQ